MHQFTLKSLRKTSEYRLQLKSTIHQALYSLRPLRLLADHEKHGSEDLGFPAGSDMVGSERKLSGRFRRARRDYSDKLEQRQQPPDNWSANMGLSQETDHVLPVLVFEFSYDRVIPPDPVRAGGQVLRMLECEPGCLDGFLGVPASLQAADSGPSLDP